MYIFIFPFSEIAPGDSPIFLGEKFQEDGSDELLLNKINKDFDLISSVIQVKINTEISLDIVKEWIEDLIQIWGIENNFKIKIEEEEFLDKCFLRVNLIKDGNNKERNRVQSF